jgi:hypothetical protein
MCKSAEIKPPIQHNGMNFRFDPQHGKTLGYINKIIQKSKKIIQKSKNKHIFK